MCPLINPKTNHLKYFSRINQLRVFIQQKGIFSVIMNINYKFLTVILFTKCSFYSIYYTLEKLILIFHFTNNLYTQNLNTNPHGNVYIIQKESSLLFY